MDCISEGEIVRREKLSKITVQDVSQDLCTLHRLSKGIILFLVKKLSLYGFIDTMFCGLLVTFCSMVQNNV